MRKRPQLVVDDLRKILRKLGKNTPIFLAPSMLNWDEPVETQEFIDWKRKVKCVAIEYCRNNPETGSEITLGWAE